MASDAPDPSAHVDYDKRWLILAVLSLGFLMIILDATVINVALPDAQQALGFSDNERQWVVTAYSLAFGSTLLLGGKISDIIGRKRTFLIGLTGFAIVSGIGGASQSFGMLVGARALQGLFGALLAPSALSLLTTTFTDPAERGKAFAVWGAVAGSGASLGLLLGGVLTQLIDWRAVLEINLIIAAIVGAGALAWLRNTKPEAQPKIDWPGTVTVTVGLFGLVYGLSRIETTNSWTDTQAVVSLIAAVVLLISFGWIESRVKEPLLPIRVLATRYRGASLLAIGLSAITLFGAFLFLTFYMQRNLGYDPIKTGVAFLPLTVLVVISASLSTTKLSRIPPRFLVTAGMLLGAASMLYLTRLGVSATYAVDILPMEIGLGAGLGLIFGPAINYATLNLTEDDAGVGSALVNTNQQVGGAVGTALLSTIAATATSSFISSHAAGASAASRAAEVAQATVHGYTTAFAWSAGFFALGAIIAFFLYPRGVPREEKELTGEPEPAAA